MTLAQLHMLADEARKESERAEGKESTEGTAADAMAFSQMRLAPS